MPESFWVKILKELPGYDEYFSGIITEDEYKQLEKDKTLEVSEEVSTYLIENEWAEAEDPPIVPPEKPEKAEKNEALKKGFHVKQPISVMNKKLLPGNVLTKDEIEWLGKKNIKALLEKGLLKQVK